MEQGEPTNEFTVIDRQGNIYIVIEFEAEGGHRYFLSDGTSVIRMADNYFEIPETKTPLRLVLTP